MTPPLKKFAIPPMTVTHLDPKSADLSPQSDVLSVIQTYAIRKSVEALIRNSTIVTQNYKKNTLKKNEGRRLLDETRLLWSY